MIATDEGRSQALRRAQEESVVGLKAVVILWIPPQM
jgi:hypothetical protein